MPADSTVVRRVKQCQKHGFTELEIEEIVAGYTTSGMSIYQLAEKHGCHRDTISSLLKRSGITVTKTRMNDATAQGAAKLYCSGLTLKQVGEHLGFSESVIRRTLLKSGVQMRKPHRYGQQDACAEQ